MHDKRMSRLVPDATLHKASQVGKEPVRGSEITSTRQHRLTAGDTLCLLRSWLLVSCFISA